MARRAWMTCAFAAAGLVQAAAGADIASTSPPQALEPRATSTPTPTSVNTACAVAASAASSYMAGDPTRPLATIAADLAYECLRSVPNHQEPAIRLLNSLRPYFEFQSTKGYLLEPPSGYLYTPVDLDGGLDNIQKKVEGGEYESEYDMQVDIITLIGSVHDGHLSWQGDLLGAFTFSRPHTLAAVSSDGEQLPQVYLSLDLVTFDNTTSTLVPVNGYTPSPVESIDGIDVVSFLLHESLLSNYQDPDATWNQFFPSLGNSGRDSFRYPYHYPGPVTNVTFANGTTQTYANSALVNYRLNGVVTGEDAYRAFCPGAVDSDEEDDSGSASLTSTSRPDPTSTSGVTVGPHIVGFPYPVIKHSANSVAGYYLNDTGLADVAVLQIREFSNDATDDRVFEQEFQQVVEKFMYAAVRTGKRKLLIDLQGNGGGLMDISTDTFAQLFPSKAPTSKTNMRDHLGFWILGNAASKNITDEAGNQADQASAINIYRPIGFQTVVTPELENFADFNALYGPNEMNSGNYSAIFQNNYTDLTSSDFDGEGIVITGTNNRTGFRQPFAAHDIVVLYDGSCSGSCATFSELLKNYGNVQFVAIGGRPQAGPMQAVGGTKGAQLFPFSGLISPYWVDLFESPDNALRLEANNTIWDNFTYYPVAREANSAGGGANGRNNFRVGDDSLTPLQFVYEAADCRIWWTKEMLYDPVFLWNRVAQIAFQGRRVNQFNSKYCVANSTGHPTSISGGWKSGTLGPQTPPENAPAKVEGWKLEGKPL